MQAAQQTPAEVLVRFQPHLRLLLLHLRAAAKAAAAQLVLLAVLVAEARGLMQAARVILQQLRLHKVILEEQAALMAPHTRMAAVVAVRPAPAVMLVQLMAAMAAQEQRITLHLMPAAAEAGQNKQAAPAAPADLAAAGQELQAGMAPPELLILAAAAADVILRGLAAQAVLAL